MNGLSNESEVICVRQELHLYVIYINFRLDEIIWSKPLLKSLSNGAILFTNTTFFLNSPVVRVKWAPALSRG